MAVVVVAVEAFIPDDVIVRYERISRHVVLPLLYGVSLEHPIKRPIRTIIECSTDIAVVYVFAAYHTFNLKSFCTAPRVIVLLL